MSKILEILGMARRASDATPATFTTTGPAAARSAASPEGLSEKEIAQLVDSLVGPVRTSAGRFERRAPAALPDETVRAIARQWTSAADEPPTAEEIETLRKFQKKAENLEATITAHGRDRAADAHDEGNRSFAEAAAAGGATELQARSRRDVDRQFEATRAAAKQELQRVCAEAWPTSAAIVRRFIAFARRRAEALAIEEFRKYLAFGLPFQPSALTFTLADLAENLEVRIAKVENTGIYPRPRSAVSPIVDV